MGATKLLSTCFPQYELHPPGPQRATTKIAITGTTWLRVFMRAKNLGIGSDCHGSVWPRAESVVGDKHMQYAVGHADDRGVVDIWVSMVRTNGQAGKLSAREGGLWHTIQANSQTGTLEI